MLKELKFKRQAYHLAEMPVLSYLLTTGLLLLLPSCLSVLN